MAATGASWRPTAALVRAATASGVFAVVAVVAGRPDLLVLAAPLVVHAACALGRRPRHVPTARAALGAGPLREGDGTVLRVTMDGCGPVEHVTLAATLRPFLAARPAGGVVGTWSPAPASSTSLDLALVVRRWGRRPVGDGLVAASSPWHGYAWGPVRLPPATVTALPLPGAFDSRAASPHPIGLVGGHPARRPGDGFEFDSIRPFHPGDRLRRVHWRVSLRTGRLHVTTAVAEEDASVLLVVDSGVEVGASGGVDGAASSLDVAVRAAGAVAEHHLTRGDRVGVRVLGPGSGGIPTAAGRSHLHRVLETLARVTPGPYDHADAEHLRFRVSPGTMVLVFSPMLSQHPVTVTGVLAARGLDVVVVDCLPGGTVPAGVGGRRALAWRMRLLERRGLLMRVARSGIPVIAWRGPGTLDEVLRQLRRRGSASTAVRR